RPSAPQADPGHTAGSGLPGSPARGRIAYATARRFRATLRRTPVVKLPGERYVHETTLPNHLPDLVMHRRHPIHRALALSSLLLAAPNVPAFSQSFTRIVTGSPVTETGAWRSVNWIDYDRDGDLDLFVTRGHSGGQDNVLFRNDGGPGFSFTRMSGLIISQDRRPSDGATWADYDNDGYPDAFVANWYGIHNMLYHN